MKFCPIRASHINWKRYPSGEVLITYTSQSKLSRLFAKFGHVDPKKKIVLDEIGSMIWHSLDGLKSLNDIVKILVEQYGLFNRINAEEAVLKYFHILERRKLIEFK